MKSILSYITERLVLSKSKNSNFITLEDFIIWGNNYDSISEWTYDEFESFPCIMSEECLTRKCHDNLSELYDYLIENLDTQVDISNPKYDGKVYIYTFKIVKYLFEIVSTEKYEV